MKQQTPERIIENAMNMALRYLSYQARTTREMMTYLKKKSIPGPVIETVINRIAQNGYIDDNDYAQRYVENRTRNKPRSKFAIRFELKKKGIASAIFDPILDRYEDRQLARKAIELKLRSWHHHDDQVFEKKVMNHLRYRGFSFEVCRETLEHFLEARQQS